MAAEHLQCGWCYIAGTELLILLISTNLYLNSHAWLMAIVLDRAASPESVSSEWAGARALSGREDRELTSTEDACHVPSCVLGAGHPDQDVFQPEEAQWSGGDRRGSIGLG